MIEGFHYICNSLTAVLFQTFLFLFLIICTFYSRETYFESPDFEMNLLHACMSCMSLCGILPPTFGGGWAILGFCLCLKSILSSQNHKKMYMQTPCKSNKQSGLQNLEGQLLFSNKLYVKLINSLKICQVWQKQDMHYKVL